ncbi:MAG TPA: PIN domain-containing protein [Pirellulales bacterium]|jgi:hypothetical protein|nr:PIN domain-containing protein [Pirellulales bacterium]
MKKSFADTFFFLAMLNIRDATHRQAVALSETYDGVIVTTHWVLVEVADAFCKPADRNRFVDLLELIEADKRMRVISASKSLFERGTELFAQRKDKSWSLTDCISFVVMDQHHIREALTADHHFSQAGFTLLLA